MRKEIILLLLGVLLNGSLHAQEYKFEVGGLAGGAFYMGDTNKNTPFKGLPLERYQLVLDVWKKYREY